jgi:hypothetical protein
VGLTVQTLDREKVTGSCEHGNEPSISIKCGDFFLPAKELLASQEVTCSMMCVNV